MKMGSIASVCHKVQKKEPVFLFLRGSVEFGTPAPLHSIPHHNVEQIVVEDDTFTGTGVFDVKHQIGDAVVRSSRVVFADASNDRGQRFSPHTQNSWIVHCQDLFHEVSKAVDSGLSPLKYRVDDRLELLHSNLVDAVLQVGHGVGLKPRVLGDGRVGCDGCAKWSRGGLSLLTRGVAADALLEPGGSQISLRAERACCGSAM